VWRIGPKERTHSTGYFNRVIDTESLQSLNVKCPIIEIAFRAFVTVNTLPLTKHLHRHNDSPYFFAPHRAKYRTVSQSVGLL
jgi:hypothetical protein